MTAGADRSKMRAEKRSLDLVMLVLAQDELWWSGRHQGRFEPRRTGDTVDATLRVSAVREREMNTARTKFGRELGLRRILRPHSAH